MNKSEFINNYDENTYDAILDFIDHAQVAAKIVNYGESIIASELGQLAMEAVTIRLGESVSRMSDLFVSDYPELRLRSVKNMRNITAHQYDSVKHEILWEAFENSLPAIVNSLRNVVSQPRRGATLAPSLDDAVTGALSNPIAAAQIADLVSLVGAGVQLSPALWNAVSSRLAEVAVAAGLPDPTNKSSHNYYRLEAVNRHLINDGGHVQ